MKKTHPSGLLVLCLAIAISSAGCSVPATTGQGKPVLPHQPAPLHIPGDVLSGNMTLAGFDSPDPRIGEVRVVVLAFKPESDMYIYTFVQTHPNGSYTFIFPEGWEAKLARQRTVFEGYGFEKAGTMPRELLWPA